MQRAFADHLTWIIEALAKHLAEVDEDAPGAKKRREQGAPHVE